MLIVDPVVWEVDSVFRLKMSLKAISANRSFFLHMDLIVVDPWIRNLKVIEVTISLLILQV